MKSVTSSDKQRPPQRFYRMYSLCVYPAEDTFLSAIINYTNSSTVHFKLSPTYVLYMACRYVLSPTYRPDMSPSERTHKVIAIVNKMVSMMEGVIQVSNASFKSLFTVIFKSSRIKSSINLHVISFSCSSCFCRILGDAQRCSYKTTFVVVVSCVCVSSSFSPQLCFWFCLSITQCYMLEMWSLLWLNMELLLLKMSSLMPVL